MINEDPVLSSYNVEWSLWEIYRHGPTIKDYEASIKKLIKIQNLHEFYELAVFIPHLQPSKLFYDKETKSKTKYKVKIDNRDEVVQIDSICMFRGDIPPLLENSRNFNGGAHYYMFYDIKGSQMDKLWLSLTTSLVINEGISHSEIINGIRFCDRWKPKDNQVQFRLEVWTESDYYNEEKFEFHKKSQEDIQRIIKENNLEVKHTYKAHRSSD